jgi:hypothetical protein
MAALGLTTPKMRALAVLSVIDGLQIRRAGGLCGGRAIHPEPRAGPLDAEGLVRREADADDSRATRIFITEAGRAAFDRSGRTWRAPNTRRMFHGIPSRRAPRLRRHAAKILGNIRKHDF